MTTEQRLERLERENRWMRRGGAVCVVLLGFAVVAAVFQIVKKATDLPDLEVRSLHVMDGHGKIRVRLGTGSDGRPVLALFDKDGNPRVGLATVADGSPSLRLFDRNKRTRAALGVSETVNKVTGATTTTAENALTFFDAKGNVIWQAPR